MVSPNVTVFSRMNSMERKLQKKWSKYESILKKDLDIEASCNPTTVRIII